MATESEFDFDEWAYSNNLEDIADLFVKHHLDTKQNLTTQSVQFAAFISDPELHETRSHLISRAVTAIQRLCTESTPSDEPKQPVSRSKYIIISQKEEQILQSLQSNLDSITAKEVYFNQLQQQHQQSLLDTQQRKDAQTELTRNKINSFFGKAINEITIQQQTTLNELDELDRINNIDEAKEFQTVSECASLIDSAKCKLSETLTKCHEIIRTATTTNSEQRKNEVIRLNNHAIMTFIEQTNELQAKMTLIDEFMAKHKDIHIDVDFPEFEQMKLATHRIVQQTRNEGRLIPGAQPIDLENVDEDDCETDGEDEEKNIFEVDTYTKQDQQATIDEQMEEIETLSTCVRELGKREEKKDKVIAALREHMQDLQRQIGGLQRNMIIEQTQNKELVKKLEYERRHRRYKKFLDDGPMHAHMNENADYYNRHDHDYNAPERAPNEQYWNGYQEPSGPRKPPLRASPPASPHNLMKEEYLQSVYDDEFKCLYDYAEQRGLKKPKIVYAQERSGGFTYWIASLHVGDIVVSSQQSTKREARIACAAQFVHEFV